MTYGRVMTTVGGLFASACLAAQAWPASAAAQASPPVMLGEGSTFKAMPPGTAVRFAAPNERGGVIVGYECKLGATNEFSGSITKNEPKGFAVSLTKAFGSITGSEPCTGGVTVAASGFPWNLSSKGGLLTLTGTPAVVFTEHLASATCVYEAKKVAAVVERVESSPLLFEGLFNGLQKGNILKLNKGLSDVASCHKSWSLDMLLEGIVEHGEAIYVKH